MVVVNLEKNPISAFYVGNNEVLSRYIPIVRARKQIIKQSILHRCILTSKLSPRALCQKKKVIFLSLIFNLCIFGDYSNHIDSKLVIDELVSKHGFDESYVIEVLKNAEKREEMLQSVAKPAEKTKTWDEYKAIFIKTKRIRDGKKFI